MPHDDDHWTKYNGTQTGRPVRPLLRDAMSMAGPGGGRTAIDLGCGAGIESKALLDAGWTVHAIDGVPLMDSHERLTVDVRHFAELDSLPAADLIYAGYSLPYQPPDSFRRVWTLMLESLRPGGVLAVNLFGENDSWAGDESETFFSADAARALFDGFDVRYWAEEDEDGPAFGGSKHWHVFDVIAVAPFSP
ncbi:class I SAM-dependent methyltransferase [Winogradskya humida]|uniref:class I SAM-dependent methyltransferase n=1 Tax=Winogradskya humida TaxID=113566 RepID=UPI0019411DDE|nr:class I SAM-dependent methyltransferase [Actinoplanes humidus]